MGEASAIWRAYRNRSARGSVPSQSSNPVTAVTGFSHRQDVPGVEAAVFPKAYGQDDVSYERYSLPA
jgi:hypothetical protein